MLASCALHIAHADETTGRRWAFTGDDAGQRYTPSETSRLRAREQLHRCRAAGSVLPQSAKRIKRAKMIAQTKWHLHDSIPSAIWISTAASRNKIEHHVGELDYFPASSATAFGTIHSLRKRLRVNSRMPCSIDNSINVHAVCVVGGESPDASGPSSTPTVVVIVRSVEGRHGGLLFRGRRVPSHF